MGAISASPALRLPSQWILELWESGPQASLVGGWGVCGGGKTGEADTEPAAVPLWKGWCVRGLARIGLQRGGSPALRAKFCRSTVNCAQRCCFPGLTSPNWGMRSEAVTEP